MEARDAHVPPPMRGDGSDPAGRLLLAWATTHRYSCRAPRLGPPTWLDDLETCFAQVDREAVAGPVELHPRQGRQASPSKKWMLQFQVCNVTCFSTYF